MTGRFALTGSRIFDGEAWHDDSAVLACFNFGATPAEVRIPVPGVVEPLVGHGFPPCEVAGNAVTVPPHGAFFAGVSAGPAR